MNDAPIYEVEFDYHRLQEDLGFPVNSLPKLFKKFYGARISRASAYAWFARGSMPLERFMQLVTIVRLETGNRLDVWRYISASKRDAA